MARGDLAGDGCVASRLVYDGRLAQIVRWECRHDGDALRSERCHTLWVVALVRRGACRLHDGPWSAVVDPATAILHRPGSPYRTTHPFGLGDAGWNIAFDPQVVDELLRTGGRGGSAGPAMELTSRPARPVVQQLVLLERTSRGLAIEPLQVEELALELLESLVAPQRAARRCDTPTAAAHRRLAERTRAYLTQHYRDVVRLPEVAEAVGSSPAHLCRVFKRACGVPMRTYLHRLRLASALDLLVESDQHIDRIAVDSGFASHSHLTTLFTREVGLAPRRVRELARRAPVRDLLRSPLFDTRRAS